MNNLFHYLLGKGEKDEKIIQEKTEQAHDIKNSVQQDLISLKQDVDIFNKDMQKHLTHISRKIGDVAEQIAVASGSLKSHE